ncbi:HIT domain-containing protein [Methylomonas sp. MgM2]
MNTFELHPRLQQDCFNVGRFPLSQLLMMNDSQYPWFILVPQRTDLSEIYQLDRNDRQQLMNESCLLSESLADIYRPDKLNIAAIGNLVPQLHVHHVARYQHDKAWPGPIWGKFEPVPYHEQEAYVQIQRLQEGLRKHLI